MSTLAELPELVGFFSYSREDDEAFRGTLSALRDGIQRELSAQLGRSKTTFRLWQDQAAIAPGKLWESEIKAAIDQSVFFIPIVTPRAVNSKYCKFEFESFLAREAAIGRSDLVFPIVYISVAALENEDKWRDDPVLSIIGRRQYVDWRPLRHLDVQTTAVGEQIERLCRRIVEALDEPWVSPEERRKMEEAKTRQQAEDERRLLEAEAKRRADEEQGRRRAEAEARQQAEEEARRLEAETKRRADEEQGRRRAEAEARQQAEEEARRLEAETKRRADEEQGRRRAEAEARQRAEEKRSRGTDLATTQTGRLYDQIQEAEAKRRAESLPLVLASVFALAIVPVQYAMAILFHILEWNWFAPGVDRAGSGFSGVLAGAMLAVVSALALVRWRGAEIKGKEVALYWLGLSLAGTFATAIQFVILKWNWFGPASSFYSGVLAGGMLAAISGVLTFRRPRSAA